MITALGVQRRKRVIPRKRNHQLYHQREDRRRDPHVAEQHSQPEKEQQKHERDQDAVFHRAENLAHQRAGAGHGGKRERSALREIRVHRQVAHRKYAEMPLHLRRR